jgi:alkaline phosphatase D
MKKMRSNDKVRLHVPLLLLLGHSYLCYHSLYTLQSTIYLGKTFDFVHGPIVGECTETSALIWYRDAFGRRKPPILKYWPMLESEAIEAHHYEVAIEIQKDKDFTSQTRLENLIPNTLYHYQIGKRKGSFKTPGSPACSFVFGSCIGGQGYGRNAPGNTDGEGFPIFETISEMKPDFFLMNGDSIYADDKIEMVSRNPWNQGDHFLTQNGIAVMHAAKDLDGFRDRYKYHLEDLAYSKFLRNCPVYSTWDDHEIVDNFGQTSLRRQGLGRLFDDGLQAFLEYWPRTIHHDDPHRIYKSFNWGPHVEVFILEVRSYRDIHVLQGGSTTPSMRYILGTVQLNWLLESLSSSKATWKFIVTSIPLSYPTGWPTPDIDGYDGWSDGKRGHIGGAEFELLRIFQHIDTENIENVIFLSGDVHFPFVLSYDPFQKGKPLVYEIAATPFHALCLSPPEQGPDDTFHPTVLYSHGVFGANLFNFGHVWISDDGKFTLDIRNCNGKSMYNLKLSPLNSKEVAPTLL